MLLYAFCTSVIYGDGQTIYLVTVTILKGKDKIKKRQNFAKFMCIHWLIDWRILNIPSLEKTNPSYPFFSHIKSLLNDGLLSDLLKLWWILQKLLMTHSEITAVAALLQSFAFTTDYTGAATPPPISRSRSPQATSHPSPSRARAASLAPSTHHTLAFWRFQEHWNINSCIAQFQK